MKSVKTVFYTTKRTLFILAAKGIKAVRVLAINISRPSGKQYNCVHVIYTTVNGTCSLFVSCKEYLKQAIAGRKQRATEYTVVQRSNPSQWNVTNNADLTSPGYTVITSPFEISCNCEDFVGQEQYLAQHRYLWNSCFKHRKICKHAYSVLSALKCDSLADYLKSWRPGGKFHQLQQRSAADDLFQQF